MASRTIAGAVLVAALCAATSVAVWSSRHPLSTSWDESAYDNFVVRLAHVYHDQGLRRILTEVRWDDRARPPMYRVAALPVAVTAGTAPQTLRALSLAVLLVTVTVLYFAARLVAGPPVALVAAACFGLSYAPLWASAHFGTEYGLYLGTAGMFYCLLRVALRPPQRRTWILWTALAVSVALGLLSKGTFLLVVVPAVPGFLLAARRWGVDARWRRLVAGAAAAGFLLAAPWYAFNYRFALAFARGAFHFGRHAYPWLPEAFWHLLGPPFAVLAVLALVMVLLRRARVRAGMTPGASIAVVTCIAGAVPMIAFHIYQVNHLMRLVSPALIPGLLGSAALVQASGALAGQWAVAACGAAMLLQGAYMTHRFATSRLAQWDWTPLRALCVQRGVPLPAIEFLGSGIDFDPPSIARPWVAQGREIPVRWLWRQEQGDIDWGTVVAAADSADVVLTVPGYAGDPEDNGAVDNQYNAEFAGRLEREPGFGEPVDLVLGSERTTVLVFFRRRPAAAP